MSSSTTLPDPQDPIEDLLPPSRPWWLRLVGAAGLIAVVAVVGFAWRGGALRPAPDCCGSGGAGPALGLSRVDGAVTVTARLFNTSGQPIEVMSARADLPGATVIDIAPYPDRFAYEMPPEQLAEFPFVVDGHDEALFAITFRPDSCTDDAGPWGHVEVDLEVAGDRWHPTLGRTFTLPEPVARDPSEISFLPPAGIEPVGGNGRGALALACALLGR